MNSFLFFDRSFSYLPPPLYLEKKNKNNALLPLL